MFTFVRWNWIFVASMLCIEEAGVDEVVQIMNRTLSIADEACS